MAKKRSLAGLTREIPSGKETFSCPLGLRALSDRVLKCDVVKMKFLKLWDLSGYSERTMSKRPTCQK